MVPIALQYIAEVVPDDLVDEFIAAIATPEFTPEVNRLERSPIYATIEWLVPTALVIFITKSYFQSFLAEMGKEHYTLLKNALKRAANRLIGQSGPDIHVLSSSGKSKKDNKYSLTFSLYVEINKKLNLKLLFPVVLKEEEVQEVIEAYTNFIDDLYSGTINDELLRRLSKGKVVVKTILITYDFETKELRSVDPFQK
ncbi:MAG: hypothetical protein WCW53_07350 [Syntrophales bacterium]